MIEFNLLCAIGLHNRMQIDKWTPSIAAEVVTEFEQTHKCARCGKVLHYIRFIWDGKEMVDSNRGTP